MKILVLVCRLIVGALFIVSGLVKANDPLGFSYKLEEYFAESALNMTAFDDWALILACLACLAEVVLGLAVLLGGKMKLTTGILLALTIFFGWLTLYTATCDPQGTYMSETRVAASSTTAVELQSRAETDAKLTFVKQDGDEFVFEEEKDVTCVTDCGCFGDALKGSLGRSLTPWESFYKDLILFILLIPIAIYAFTGKIKLNTTREDVIYMGGGLLLVALLGGGVFGWWFPVLFTAVCFAVAALIKRVVKKPSLKEWSIAAAMTLLTIGFMYYTYNHLPIKDYRAYKVGTDIQEAKKQCHEIGLPCPEYANIYIVKDKATGEEYEMQSDVYLTSTDKVDFVSATDKQITLVEGYMPQVVDFLFDSDDVLTEEILDFQGYTLLIISKDLSLLGDYDTIIQNEVVTLEFKADDATKTAFDKLKALSAKGEAAGAKTVGWAAGSSWEQIEAFRHQLQLAFPVYSGDDKTLKTIIRSNPGLVLLKDGVIKGKWHANDIPDWEGLQQYMQ